MDELDLPAAPGLVVDDAHGNLVVARELDAVARVQRVLGWPPAAALGAAVAQELPDVRLEPFLVGRGDGGHVVGFDPQDAGFDRQDEGADGEGGHDGEGGDGELFSVSFQKVLVEVEGRGRKRRLRRQASRHQRPSVRGPKRVHRRGQGGGSGRRKRQGRVGGLERDCGGRRRKRHEVHVVPRHRVGRRVGRLGVRQRRSVDGDEVQVAVAVDVRPDDGYRAGDVVDDGAGGPGPRSVDDKRLVPHHGAVLEVGAEDVRLAVVVDVAHEYFFDAPRVGGDVVGRPGGVAHRGPQVLVPGDLSVAGRRADDVDVAVAVEVAGPRVDGDLDPLYDRFVRPKFPIGSYVVHVEPHDVLVVHRRDDDVVDVVPVHVGGRRARRAPRGEAVRHHAIRPAGRVAVVLVPRDHGRAAPPRRGQHVEVPVPVHVADRDLPRALVDVGQDHPRAPRLSRPVRVLVPREDHVLEPSGDEVDVAVAVEVGRAQRGEHVVKRQVFAGLGRCRRHAPYPRPGRAARADAVHGHVRLRPHHDFGLPVAVEVRRGERLGVLEPVVDHVPPITQTLLRRRMVDARRQLEFAMRLPGRRRRGGKRRKDQAYATHATRASTPWFYDNYTR